MPLRDLPARFAAVCTANLHWLGLIILGLLSQLLYLRYFLRPYPLLRLYDVPLLDLGKVTNYSHGAARDFVIVFLLLFALAYAAYLLCRGHSSPVGLMLVLLFAFLCGLALVLVYPIAAADIFEYIAYARIHVFHGANPHMYRPIDFLEDRLMWYSAWPGITSPYGPVWTGLSAVIGRLSGPSLLTYMLLFKGLALVVHLLNSAVIYAFLARWRPSYAVAGAVLYAWNPLVLFESAAGGHNDGLVVFFILLAVYLFGRGRFALAIPVAALSSLVKMPTVIVVPLFVLGAWRALSGKTGRVRTVGLSVAATVAMAILVHAPFWEGSESLGWLARENLFTSSFATLAVLALQRWVEDAELVQSVVRYAALGVFALFYAWQLVRLRGEIGPFLEGLYWTVFVFLCVAVLWWQPWYLVWLVALGAVIPSVGIARLTLLFSYSATWNYVVFIFFLMWFFPLMMWGNSMGVTLVAVASIFGAPLVYAGYLTWRGRPATVPAG